MDGFWQLVRDSVIVQGLLTIMFAGAWLYMIVTDRVPPDAMTSFLALIIGFYFGAKVQSLVARGPNAPGDREGNT